MNKKTLMFSQPMPNIDGNSKVLVAIGDSFTQGVGSWSDETYKKHNGWINPLGIKKQSLIDEMYKNSFVSQIVDSCLPEYQAVNLGVLGTGNRAAVKELYLHPELNLQKAKHVVVIFLLSGIERFDFVEKEFNQNSHFYTMWPNPWDKNSTHRALWKAYSEKVWSDKFSIAEAILNILEAQTICKANGWELVISSAFEQRYTKEYFQRHLGLEWNSLIETINWDNFLYPRGMNSFIELLLDYDGNRHMALGDFYDHYSKLKWPTKHITNCMHPTREGYRIIADDIYNFMLSKNFIR